MPKSTKKRSVQSGKTIAILSRNITKRRFVFTDKLGSADEWASLCKYRSKLQFVDDAQEGCTVSARELHKALGSKRKFTDWIQTRFEQNQAKADVDFNNHKFVKVGRNKQGTRQQILDDYLLTPELAKMMAMQEGTEVGFAVRRYFVLCERIAKRFMVFNASRAIKLTELDNRLKHELIKRGIREHTSKVHHEVSKTLTGWTPSEWEQNIGERPRDALNASDREKFISGYEYVVTLLESGMKGTQAFAMLQKAKAYFIPAASAYGRACMEF